MLQLILGFILISHAFAAPQTIEVWFLSAHKKAEIQKLINEKPYVLRSLTADLQCQQMGDFCFDPQFGLYTKDDEGADTNSGKVSQDKGPSIPPAQSVDRELIDCDPKNYFDVFCGKARKEAKANFKLDLWIDTSSSMREMDFSDQNGSCFRKSLVQRLDKTCGFNQKVNVMMFDTSLKQAGTMDSVCNNVGLNDVKKMIDWIERSDAKKLVIITDIYEFHKDFADYIENKHGKFRGDKDPIVAAQLMDMVGELESSCR
jgi:hypothetical protein